MPYDTKANRNVIATMGCVVCSHCMGIDDTPASLHHVKEYPGQPRPKRHIIPLCPHHHQYGGHGEAVHAGVEAWENRFEPELFFVEVIDRQLKQGK